MTKQIKSLLQRQITMMVIIIYGVLFFFFLGWHIWMWGETKYEHVSNIAMFGKNETEKILSKFKDTDLFDFNYKKITIEEIQYKYTKYGVIITPEYYKQIADGDFARYHTDYDTNMLLEKWLKYKFSSFIRDDILFAHMADINGYIPFHSVGDKKLTGDFAYDEKNFREKRIFRNAAEKLRKHNLIWHLYQSSQTEQHSIPVVGIPIFLTDMNGKRRQYGWFVMGYDIDVWSEITKFSSFFFTVLMIGGIIISLLIPYILKHYGHPNGDF